MITFSDIMLSDFQAEYSRTIKKYGYKARYMKRRQLIKETINRQAPRFYITEDAAKRVISKMLKGEMPKYRTEQRMQMYKDMFSLFLEWKKENPYSSISAGVDYVVNNKAPRFYVSLSHAINRFK